MESGTSSLREMKPGPMPSADGRDAHPYLARMAFAGGSGFAVGGLMWRTSGDAGPYLGWLGQHAVLPLPEAGGLSWGDGLQGRRVEVAGGLTSFQRCTFSM
jgi:hypothetical protein